MAPSGLHILVVEDDSDGREALKFLLSDWGHRVDFASDAKGALLLVRSLRPAVILLDLGLPGDVDGCQLAKLLRRESEAESVIIAYSGFPDFETQALAEGCDYFIAKPAIEALEEMLGPNRRVQIPPRRAPAQS
jgi:CheY-like chemotaxis protein